MYTYVDGDDFFFTSLNITFLAGSINSTFNITINDDDIFEINETFNVNLFIVSPLRSTITANGTTTVQIVDDDCEC